MIHIDICHTHIIAAESYMLLVIYSYEQTMQDKIVTLGGTKFGTEDSLLRRPMFHLMASGVRSKGSWSAAYGTFLHF